MNLKESLVELREWETIGQQLLNTIYEIESLENPIERMPEKEKFSHAAVICMEAYDMILDKLPVTFQEVITVNGEHLVASRIDDRIVFQPAPSVPVDFLDSEAYEGTTHRQILKDILDCTEEKATAEHTINELCNLLPDHMAEVLTINGTCWAVTRSNGGSIEFTPLA